MNHIIFILHSVIISASVLFFGWLGNAALTSLISLLFVLTNIFVIKQIEIYHYALTTADAYIIGISFGINILQEIWGKKTAQKAIFISFACSLFYVIMGQFHLWYIPASYDTSHVQFIYLMNHSIRIMSASLASYLIVQYFDTITYGYLKTKADGKWFIVRNYISMLTSQLFDTLLFSFLGLYGIVHNITHIIIISYLIKTCAIFLMTPALYFAKKIIKNN
jgi:uncharacterized integral membrane protein (TIGR00697 family)